MTGFKGDIWVMNPETQTVTNRRTGETRWPEKIKRAGIPLVTVDVGHGDEKCEIDKKTGALKLNKKGEPSCVRDPGSVTVPGSDGSVAWEYAVTLLNGKEAANNFAAFGADVILTRGDNSFARAGDGFTYRRRAGDAADIVVSIHMDIDPKKKATGSRIWLENTSSQKSKDLAAYISLNDTNGDGKKDYLKDAEIRSRKLAVLRVSATGFLAEIEFATNAKAVDNLRSVDHARAMTHEMAWDTLTWFRKDRGMPSLEQAGYSPAKPAPKTPDILPQRVEIVYSAPDKGISAIEGKPNLANATMTMYLPTKNGEQTASYSFDQKARIPTSAQPAPQLPKGVEWASEANPKLTFLNRQGKPVAIEITRELTACVGKATIASNPITGIPMFASILSSNAHLEIKPGGKSDYIKVYDDNNTLQCTIPAKGSNSTASNSKRGPRQPG